MALAAARCGLIYEDKGSAIALHYRLMPEAAPKARALMQETAHLAGPDYRLREGKCVFELAPATADKGKALRSLMAAAPYHGRRPLALGDDITDEAMFDAANGLGGIGLRIGTRAQPTQARLSLPSPKALRAWIDRSI